MKKEDKPVTPIFINSIRKRSLWNEIRYYTFYIWWNWLEMRPLKIKSFFQRGWRGWADEDTWNLNYYLATVISQSVKHLKDNWSYPTPTKKQLNDIIEGFEANIKTQEMTFLAKDRDVKKRKLKFIIGMNLFYKYFNHLWD